MFSPPDICPHVVLALRLLRLLLDVAEKCGELRLGFCGEINLAAHLPTSPPGGEEIVLSDGKEDVVSVGRDVTGVLRGVEDCDGGVSGDHPPGVHGENVGVNGGLRAAGGVTLQVGRAQARTPDVHSGNLLCEDRDTNLPTDFYGPDEGTG